MVKLEPKRLYYREPFSIFSVLAERDWRFGVVQGDGNSFPPIFPPKSKPQIGATRELLLFTFASCGANQSEAWILGSFWGHPPGQIFDFYISCTKCSESKILAHI